MFIEIIQFLILVFPILKTFIFLLCFFEQKLHFFKKTIDNYFDDDIDFEDEELELNKQIILILLVLEFFWIIMS
jgi:hypothetical protein